LEGLNFIVLSPETAIPSIGDVIGTYFKEKVIGGSPEEQAEFAGQLTFEIAQLFIGTGEVKAGATVAKTGTELSTGLKAIKTTTTVEKALSAGKYLESALLKNLGKTLDTTFTRVAQKGGDYIDNLRFMLKNNSNGLIPSYAGIGSVDDFMGTGEMIQKSYAKFKAKYMTPEAPRGNGVNIKPGVASENLGTMLGKLLKE
jgi:hypothetical protein